ncbi:MAG: hemerythrin domain-containing protein, partial [Rhodobacteraceae bacterium]|nr:hemerythrin domain-containing protein [Paracoccaceae bacterium]
PAETGALIDFIVARCHERHRADLPGLIALAVEVEAAAGGRADAPCGLADLLDGLRAGLEEHMLKEELRVFPLMRAARRDLLAHPLALMRAEHEDNAEFLLRAEHLTRGFRPPAGAGPAWERLCAELARFQEDLVAHVFLEERALFPRFEADEPDQSTRRPQRS